MKKGMFVLMIFIMGHGPVAQSYSVREARQSERGTPRPDATNTRMKQKLEELMAKPIPANEAERRMFLSQLSSEEKNRALIIAARDKHFDTFKEFLEAGADPNYVSEGGLTPLAHATTYEMAETLLRAGADPNQLSGGGDLKKTPLHWRSEHPQIVSLLLRSGADPYIKDESGVTALANAAKDCSYNSVYLMLNLAKFNSSKEEDIKNALRMTGEYGTAANRRVDMSNVHGMDVCSQTRIFLRMALRKIEEANEAGLIRSITNFLGTMGLWRQPNTGFTTVPCPDGLSPYASIPPSYIRVEDVVDVEPVSKPRSRRAKKETCILTLGVQDDPRRREPTTGETIVPDEPQGDGSIRR